MGSHSSDSLEKIIIQMPDIFYPPELKIIIQPERCDQRFRYGNENRATGLIKGIGWTQVNPIYPQIFIINYDKPVTIYISCITKNEPYYQHPHKLFGPNDEYRRFENGICVITMNGGPHNVILRNIGIECTKGRDMEQALIERRNNNFISYNVLSPSQYDIHEMRLCYQAYLHDLGISLGPVVSEPFSDRPIPKIVRLCDCEVTASNNKEKMLFCEEVNANDIKIKFTQYDSEGNLIWFAYADKLFVHKKTSISFRTPTYDRTNITIEETVFIQLERPSDNTFSEPMEFKFKPDLDSLERRRQRYLQWSIENFNPNI